MPPIPHVREVLRDPISALVRMSYILRGVLVEVLDEIVARDGHAGLPPIVKEKAEYLELAEKVMGAWSDHLGLTWDDEPNRNGHGQCGTHSSAATTLKPPISWKFAKSEAAPGK